MPVAGAAAAAAVKGAASGAAGAASQKVGKKAAKTATGGGRTKTTGTGKSVANSLVLILGLNLLKYGLVDKSLPRRAFWIRMAFLGFGLALLAETMPRVGKAMAYLILAGVAVDRGDIIIKELELLEKKDDEAAKEAAPSNAFGAHTNPDRNVVSLYGGGGPAPAAMPEKNRRTPFIDPQEPRNSPRNQRNTTGWPARR